MPADMRHEAAYAATPTHTREDLSDACKCRRTTSTPQEEPVCPGFAFLTEVTDVSVDSYRGSVSHRDFVRHSALARFRADREGQVASVEVVDREHAELAPPQPGVQCQEYERIVTLAIAPGAR